MSRHQNFHISVQDPDEGPQCAEGRFGCGKRSETRPKTAKA